MQEKFIGEIIREKRKELHLTQAQLCEGICEPPTLSRIENKKQTPTRNILNALLQRLGMSDERFYAAITVDEMEINRLFIEITSYNVQFAKAAVNEKADIKRILQQKQKELQNIIEDDDVISLQFLTRSQVLISDCSSAEKIKKLLWAMQLTHPSFDLESIRDGLYSFDEVQLINHIAVIYSEEKESKKAIKIWNDLSRNIENRFDSIMPARAQKDLIYFGLARELLVVGDYRKASHYAEEGRETAINYGIYQHLPGFIIILAECEHQFDNIAKSKELFKEAYYLCRAIGDKANEKIITDGYRDYYSESLL